MRDVGSGRLFRGLLAIVGIAAIAPSAFAQETMYGGTADSQGGSIVIVDQETAAYETVGDPVEEGKLPAIAMDASGALWVANIFRTPQNEKVSVLRRVDAATGAVVATIGTITDARDSEQLRITSMEFDPVTGRLFGVSARGPKEASIFVIDTETAIATFVGATGLKRGGLAFTPDGRLFLATTDDPDGFNDPVIAQIDPATAAVIGTPVELSLGNGIEGLAVRPSDGAFFGNYADGSHLYTIDPVTGEQVSLGRYSGNEGHVADLTFRPGPPVVAGDGFLVPQRVIVKINDRRPDRSVLKAKAALDGCCGGLDLTKPLTLHINGASWELTGAKVNKKSTRLVFRDGPLKVVVGADLRGTSRGALSVTLKDVLDGIAAPDAAVTLRLVGSGLDLTGTAHLEGTQFNLRRGHEVDAPPIVPVAIRGRVRDPGKSSVLAVLDLTDGGPMPDEAPDVTIAIGAFEQSLEGAAAATRGEHFDWAVPATGVRKLRLDYGKRRVTIVLKKATVGYAGGPLTVRLRIGDAEHTVTVLPSAKGAAFRY